MRRTPTLKQYEPYFVRWIDTFVSPTGWWTKGDIERAIDQENKHGCETIGYFIAKKNGYLMFAAGLDRSDNNDVRFFHAFAIPQGWIKELKAVKQ